MIKRILDTTKDKIDDVMLSVLLYIDTTLDKHEDRLDKNDERMKSFEDKLTEFDKNFDSTKAEVESNIDKKKGIYKAVTNAVIVAIVAYILSRLGIGGG